MHFMILSDCVVQYWLNLNSHWRSDCHFLIYWKFRLMSYSLCFGNFCICINKYCSSQQHSRFSSKCYEIQQGWLEVTSHFEQHISWEKNGQTTCERWLFHKVNDSEHQQMAVSLLHMMLIQSMTCMLWCRCTVFYKKPSKRQRAKNAENCIDK